MSLIVGDLLTVIRIKDEASAAASRVFTSLGQGATAAAATVSRNLTPAVNSAKAAVQAFIPSVNSATAALGGGGGGGATGGGGGGGGAFGGGGGGFGGAAQSAYYQITLLGRGMREFGYFATTYITVPLSLASGISVKLAADFELVTQKLSALANVAESDLGRVREQLLGMAPAVGVGPVELAKGMYAVSSTVDDASQALDILQRSAKLSAVGLGETEVVAKALTTVIKAYPKGMYDAARAADILVKGIKMGGAEANELAPTLAKVIPFAAKMGVSFEEVSANLATITQLGVPTSEAVTSLASVFAALTRETNRGNKALGTIGMSYGDLKAMLKDQGLAATLNFLVEKFGLADGRLFDVVGRIEALKNILGVTGPQLDNYAKALDGANKSTGEADEAFRQISQTFSFQFKQMLAELKSVGIIFGTAILPHLLEFVNAIKNYVIPALRGLAEAFKNLPSGVQQVALAIGGLLIVIGPFSKAIGMLLMSFSNVSRVLTYFSAGGNGAAAIANLMRFLNITTVPLTSALFPLTAAILAFWAAVKIGQNEDVKNFLAEWFLTAPNATAALGRWVMGVERMAPAEAKAAIAASAAAEAYAKEAVSLNKKAEALKLVASHSPGIYKPVASHSSPDEEEKKLKQTLDISRGMLASIEKEYRGLSATQKEIIQNYVKLGQTSKAAEAAQTTPEVVERYVKSLQQSEKAATKKVASDKKLNEEMRKFSENIKNLPLDKVTNINKNFTESIEIYSLNAEKLHSFQRRVELFSAKWQDFLDLGGQYHVAVEDNKPAMNMFEDHLKRATAFAKSAEKGIDNLVGAMRRLSQAAGKSNIGEFFSNVSEALATWQVAAKAGEEMKTAMAELKTEGGDTANALMSLAAAALTAAAAIAQVTESGSTSERALKGAAVGARAGASAFGVIGAAIGGVIGLIVGFARAQDAMQARMFANRKATREVWTEWDLARGHLIKLGEAARLFGHDLEFLNDAKEDWHAEALAEIIADIEAKLGDINTELDGILDAGIELGIGLPQHLQEAILKMIDLGLISDEVAAKFHSMLADGEVDWKKMKEAADRYGITEAELGQAFNQARMNDVAKQIINDFDILTRGGADAEAVLKKMGPQINKLVQDSIKFGTTIPENMKPWIEKMIAAGELVDENGNKITDLKDIKFAAPIKTEFEKLAEALQKFIDKMDELFKRMANPPNMGGAGGGSGGGGGAGGGGGEGDGGGDPAPFADPRIGAGRGKISPKSSIITGSPVYAGAATASAPLRIEIDKRVVADVVIDMVRGRRTVRGA